MLLSIQRISFVKIFIAIAVSCLFFSIQSCSKGAFSSNVPPTPVKTDTTPTVKPIYALVWSDEFDGTAVDTSKWTFDLGNLNVNKEKEFYQTQNATVSNGNLVITAKK